MYLGVEMIFETIIILKDGCTYQSVNMFEKKDIYGRFLKDYPDVIKKTQGLKPGDVIVYEETGNIFKENVLEVKKLPNDERKENLKRAYYQLLNCVDAEPYDFDNHPYIEKINGIPFSELDLYLTSRTIIESFIKIKSKELNRNNLKALQEILSKMTENMVNIIGVKYNLGYSNEDIQNAFLVIKEKYNLKTDKEAKEIIHANCLKYLNDIGNQVFAFDKAIDINSEKVK